MEHDARVISSNEDLETLEHAAHDGTIDIAEWPRVLEALLQRLHNIVYHEFPIPSLPTPPPLPPTIDPEVVASTPPQLPTSNTEAIEHATSVEEENEQLSGDYGNAKENDVPTELAAAQPLSSTHAQPSYPGYEISQSQQTEEIPSEQMAALAAQSGTLPPELLSLYTTSRRILEYDFSASPPYTIQRLTELILHPRKHYRFLPAFLRALDRIVSVNSPVSDFPLPTLHNPLNGGFLTNGEAQVNGFSEREGLGSDESLGGALLTPIPWLRNRTNMLTPTTQSASGNDGELRSESTETIEGPHGAGSIETVSVTVNGVASAMTGSASQPNSSPIASPTLSEQSDASTSSASSTEAQLRELGGVTQGELLRQEQEAGVVPVGPSGQPMTPRRTLMAGGAAAVGRDNPVGSTMLGTNSLSLDEEQPHARGPEAMTLEDMGPQPHPIDGSGSAVLDMEAAVGRGRSKSPQPPPSEDLFKRDESDEMDMGEPGGPGKDPKDVEKEVEKLKEAMDRERREEVKDADGDVVVADADGVPVDAEHNDDEARDSVPDAVDTTGQ